MIGIRDGQMSIHGGPWMQDKTSGAPSQVNQTKPMVQAPPPSSLQPPMGNPKPPMGNPQPYGGPANNQGWAKARFNPGQGRPMQVQQPKSNETINSNYNAINKAWQQKQTGRGVG